MEVGGSEAQEHSHLHSEFHASQSQRRQRPNKQANGKELCQSQSTLLCPEGFRLIKASSLQHLSLLLSLLLTPQSLGSLAFYCQDISEIELEASGIT